MKRLSGQLTGLLYDTVTDSNAWASAIGVLKASGWISSASVNFLDHGSGQQLPIYGDCDDAYAQLFVDKQIHNPPVARCRRCGRWGRGD